jgi:glycosyltransferase involved in cell wall biosynthesis
MNRPPVSVLMTLFNRERYVGAAIESVLAQTFGEFELLIVDDGSTDASLDIARSYAARDSRIRVVVNERNLGQFENRNHAATLARGAFLKYHDSDDLMYPHCLATMVPPLAAEPRAGFGLSLSRDFAGGPCPMLLTPRMSYQRDFLGYDRMFQGGPACGLFRAEVLRALGGFPLRGVASDNLFWLHACARVSVLALPADLFWYRRHSGQELESAKAARDYAIVPGERLRALDSPHCPLTAEEREQAKRSVVRELAKLTIADLRRERYEIASLRLDHAGLAFGDWLRYLRRPHRSLTIGTPLDEHGEFLVPDWRHFSWPVTSWARSA